MDLQINYQGKVDDNGSLTIFNKHRFYEDLKMFGGKDIMITVKRKRRSRSLLQNSYYHGVCVPLVKQGLYDIGYRMGIEQVHDLLKSKFLVDEHVNENTGEILKSVGSTKKLTTSEMMDYIAQIQQFAGEFLGVVIPDPGQQVEIELK